MDESRRLCLMVGLPASGKTTFLAALWHIAEEGDVPGSLRLERLTGDRTYLNEIRARWLACEPLEHTATGEEREVAMLLSDESGDTVDLVVPDLSGESYVSQWSHRRWPQSFDEWAVSAMGVLLFVNPVQLREPQTIEDMNAILAAIGGENGDDAAASRLAAVADPEWSPEETVDQVQLVEVLQFLVERRRAGDVLPVAVVISAWDVVSPSELPDVWLASRVPLLEQYLLVNVGVHPFQIFGVSAQGGEIEQDRERLLALTPSERPRVVVAREESSDISWPLRWLLEKAPDG